MASEDSPSVNAACLCKEKSPSHLNKEAFSGPAKSLDLQKWKSSKNVRHRALTSVSKEACAKTNLKFI